MSYSRFLEVHFGSQPRHVVSSAYLPPLPTPPTTPRTLTTKASGKLGERGGLVWLSYSDGRVDIYQDSSGTFLRTVVHPPAPPATHLINIGNDVVCGFVSGVEGGVEGEVRVWGRNGSVCSSFGTGKHGGGRVTCGVMVGGGYVWSADYHGVVNHWKYTSPQHPLQWLSQTPTNHQVYSMCYIYQQQHQHHQEQVWLGCRSTLLCYGIGRREENEGGREIFSPILLRNISVGTPGKTVLSSLTFIPMTNHIWCSTSTDQSIFVWNMDCECVNTIQETDYYFSQKKKARLGFHKQKNNQPPIRKNPIPGIRCARATSDSSEIIFGGLDGSCLIFDTFSRECIQREKGMGAIACVLSIHGNSRQNGDIFWLVDMAGKVNLWGSSSLCLNSLYFREGDDTWASFSKTKSGELSIIDRIDLAMEEKKRQQERRPPHKPPLQKSISNPHSSQELSRRDSSSSPPSSPPSSPSLSSSSISRKSFSKKSGSGFSEYQKGTSLTFQTADGTWRLSTVRANSYSASDFLYLCRDKKAKMYTGALPTAGKHRFSVSLVETGPGMGFLVFDFLVVAKDGLVIAEVQKKLWCADGGSEYEMFFNVEKFEEPVWTLTIKGQGQILFPKFLVSVEPFVEPVGSVLRLSLKNITLKLRKPISSSPSPPSSPPSSVPSSPRSSPSSPPVVPPRPSYSSLRSPRSPRSRTQTPVWDKGERDSGEDRERKLPSPVFSPLSLDSSPRSLPLVMPSSPPSSPPLSIRSSPRAATVSTSPPIPSPRFQSSLPPIPPRRSRSNARPPSPRPSRVPPLSLSPVSSPAAPPSPTPLPSPLPPPILPSSPLPPDRIPPPPPPPPSLGSRPKRRLGQSQGTIKRDVAPTTSVTGWSSLMSEIRSIDSAPSSPRSPRSPRRSKQDTPKRRDRRGSGVKKDKKQLRQHIAHRLSHTNTHFNPSYRGVMDLSSTTIIAPSVSFSSSFAGSSSAPDPSFSSSPSSLSPISSSTSPALLCPHGIDAMIFLDLVDKKEVWLVDQEKKLQILAIENANYQVCFHHFIGQRIKTLLFCRNWRLQIGEGNKSFLASPSDAIALVSEDGWLFMWSISQRTKIVTRRLFQKATIVQAFYFEPSETFIFLNDDGMVSLWSSCSKLITLEMRKEIHLNEPPVCMALVNSHIWIGTKIGTIHQISSSSFEYLGSFLAHNSPVQCLISIPYPRCVWSFSKQEKMVYFWDPDTCEAIVGGKGTSDSIVCVDCSSDGRMVICGGEEGELLWWDVWSFSLVRVEKTPHFGGVGSVVFRKVGLAEGGGYGVEALSAGRDGGAVVLWKMSSSDLRAKKKQKTK